MQISKKNEFSKIFLQTMNSINSCPPLLGEIDEPLKQRIAVVNNRVSEHFSNAPFRIAFCGVFSAGKSSLINALLKCDYKLPTGINPITKIVTRIKYGDEPSYSYFYNGQKVVLDKSRTSRVIKGEEKLPKGCSEVTLALPAELLKKNVEILDTPGFDDEMGGELEYMSRRAITNADMVVLCCSALQLGKMMERELINELESAAGNFCMAVTRTDCLNTEEDKADIRKKAQWLMQGRGNLAMLHDATGKCFHVACIGAYVTLDGFDKYLGDILNDQNCRDSIRNSTDMLSMVSVVADLSGFSAKIQHEIDLSSIRGELPWQELQETFVGGMNSMMKTAGNYCPQCGRAMKKGQTICPVCGRVHQIKIQSMNQETKDKLNKISHLVSKDNADYSICWSMEARKIANIVEQTKQLTAASDMPGVTEMLKGDLESLLAHCRDAEFQIAIVGVMKAGKSMLMNALMGTEIASVDINPETASLTKFHSADHFYIKVYFHGNEEWEKLNNSAQKSASSKLSKLLSASEVKNLSKKWLGHSPLEKHCETKEELRDLVAHWTSARSYDHLFASVVEVGIDRTVFDMPDEVIFVDTPGLHDPVQYRSDITKDYIKKANAVLIAVPARALTAEGLETITTVLDYIGTKKEKAFIVATQKDLNSSKECEKVITGWIEHLVDAKRYKDESEARERIIVTTGKMFLIAEKFIKLDDKTMAEEITDDDFDDFEAYVKGVMRTKRESNETGIIRRLARQSYDITLLREKTEDAGIVLKDTGIPALRDCLSKSLLSQYKELKMVDIRDEYIRCRAELTQIVSAVKKTNIDMLSSVHSGADALKKKLDESSKAYEIAKIKNKEIRDAAAAVRSFNNQLIESLR